MKLGKYEVRAKDRGAGFMPMEIALSGDETENIKVGAKGEAKGVADEVFRRLSGEIVKNQALNVDTVNGAAISSHGVIDGVISAVSKVGGDPDEWKKRAKPAGQRGKDEAYTIDAVIAGADGVGLATAARSIQRNKKVIVLEKFPQVDGNTSRAGSPMNVAEPDQQEQFKTLAGGKGTLEGLVATPIEKVDPEYQTDFKELQRQIKGYVASGANYLFDSKLLHEIQTYLGSKRIDLKNNGIHGNCTLVKELAGSALDSVHWLADLGVVFDRSQVTVPVDALQRRGHKPVEPMDYAFIHVLGNWVKEHDGTVLADIRARYLIIENGKVCGVVAKKPGGSKITIHAKAAILTARGFGVNAPIVQKYNTYWRHTNDNIATTNSPTITGDGISLGKEAGADLVGMGFIQMMSVSDPEAGELFTGLQAPPEGYIMVNQKGKRFVNELAEHDVLTEAAIDNGGLFYLVAGDKIKDIAYSATQESIDTRVKADTLPRADSLEELAGQIGMDPDTLVGTIKEYNSYIDTGEDPDFGKSAFNLKCEVALFYVTSRKPAIHHTMGGLKIGTGTHVLDEDGKQISGLYAAGEVAGGIHAGSRLGGNSLTDIFTFGRIATNSAIDESEKQYRQIRTL